MELSENAAAALENIRESQGIPENSGARLTADRGPSGDLSLRLEFVPGVSEDDHVVEQSGTEIYLAPEVVEPLEEALMDVRDGAEGLAFVFRNLEG